MGRRGSGGVVSGDELGFVVVRGASEVEFGEEWSVDERERICLESDRNWSTDLIGRIS